MSRQPPREPEPGRSGPLWTAAAALSVLAGLVGVSFGIQALSLGRADTSSHLVVEAVAKLEHYHRSRTLMLVNGIRLSSVCIQGWEGRERVATVRLSDGVTLREVGDKLVSTGPLVEAEFELAGCPHALTKLLAETIRNGDAVRLSSTRYRGSPAYRVSFPGSAIKLSLVLPRRGGLPLALGFEGPSVKGSSRVGYGTAVALGG